MAHITFPIPVLLHRIRAKMCGIGYEPTAVEWNEQAGAYVMEYDEVSEQQVRSIDRIVHIEFERFADEQD